MNNVYDNDLSYLATNDQSHTYIKELKLYNEKNRLVKQADFKALKVRIETADLPPGLYILHIIKPDGTDRKQVMIGR